MATLQKFKLLATQCAVVAGSPTRSPSASPVIHLRRRKTLRMLLNRTDRRFSRRNDSPSEMDSDPNPTSRNNNNNNNNNNKNNNKNSSKEVRVRHKLKDLFVSSPPIEDRVSEPRFNRQEDEVGFLPATGSAGGSGGGGGGGGGGNGFAARRGGGIGPFRPITASFRYRLLRRPWRPVLVTIPE